jgi:hypothetical protein
VFDMPDMAQDQLIAAAGLLSGWFVLSDFRHLLKVKQYRALNRALWPRYPRGIACRPSREVCVATQFSDASLRNDAATKMDDDVGARFFSWRHFLKLLASHQPRQQRVR